MGRTQQPCVSNLWNKYLPTGPIFFISKSSPSAVSYATEIRLEFTTEIYYLYLQLLCWNFQHLAKLHEIFCCLHSDIHSSYLLVNINFVAICACENNRQISCHHESTSHLRHFTGQLWWHHNAKSEKTVLGDNGEMICFQQVCVFRV